jgi:hypothetical protein
MLKKAFVALAIVGGLCGVAMSADKAPPTLDPLPPVSLTPPVWEVHKPGGDAADPLAGPVLEPATLQCLGAYWIVKGDDNRNGRINVEYRQAGQQAWRKGMPMFRVQKGATSQKTHQAELNPPPDCWLFAGSVVGLAPDTEYELKLTLSDPDGPAAGDERVLKTRTIAEPAAPAGMRVRHVVPGKSGGVAGGDGSEKDPFQGLDRAAGEAQAGDLMLLHKGTYEGGLKVTRGGQAGKPIIWRAASDGEVVLSGGPKAGRGVEAKGVEHVWLEGLTVKGFEMGVLLLDCSNIVIRRCHLTDVKCGIYNYFDDKKAPTQGLFISDNVLEGPFTWGKDNLGAATEEYRGLQLTGRGIVVCYNRIARFKDGMDTFPSKCCSAIDFHNNEVSECMDDGCEMDFSERNTRCFDNRFTNVFEGISEQPIFGGPTYVFRNAIYNVKVEPFKLHHNGGPDYKIDWAPSGALIMHNTIVVKGEPACVYTGAPVYNCVYRNNLFIGGGKRAVNFDSAMIGCDFDYDGYGGGPWDIFMKWNNVRYATFEQAKAKCPVERHMTLVDAAGAFAAGIERPADVNQQYDPAKTDLRLKAGSAAIDAGEVIPGLNDGFGGKAPDLGAYECGSELPQYGPRPVK